MVGSISSNHGVSWRFVLQIIIYRRWERFGHRGQTSVCPCFTFWMIKGPIKEELSWRPNHVLSFIFRMVALRNTVEVNLACLKKKSLVSTHAHGATISCFRHMHTNHTRQKTRWCLIRLHLTPPSKKTLFLTSTIKPP